ncbi:GAF domain-containing protein [Anaerolineales bacterium HSG6]|nr:GAF domain-containing protein [Anaerolineales bacterium HSG6]
MVVPLKMIMAFASVTNEPLKKTLRFFFVVLIAITLAVNTLTPIFALDWAKQPFIGTFLYATLAVSNSHNPNWSVPEQGIGRQDVLIKVDDQPLASSRQLSAILFEQAIGDSVTLEFDRAPRLPDQSANQPNIITVTLNTFSSPDLLTFFWLPYIIGLVYLCIGFIVYHFRGIDRNSGAFISHCLFISIFAAGLFDQHTTHYLTPIWAISFPFIGATFLHLSLMFPLQSKMVQRRPKIYLWPYLIAFVFGSIYLYSLYFASDPRFSLSIWLLNYGFIGLTVAIFFVHLLQTRFSIISANIRQQAVIMLIGMLLAFTPAAIWGVSNLLDYDFGFSWQFFVGVFTPLVVFPLSMGYASLRYRIPDLDVAFSRAAVYAVLTLGVSVWYIIVTIVLSLLLQDAEIFRDPIVLTVFIITLVVILGPIKDRLQSFINHRFLRSAVDYRRLLQNYGRELISISLNTDNVLELLVQHAALAFKAEPIIIFLRNPGVNAFSIRYQDYSNDTPVEVRFGLSDDLAQWLADNKDILQLSPTGSVSKQVRIHQEELARLNMLDLILCVPLLGSKHLLGWFSLGLKKSGQPYGQEDLTFLATMSSQTTIALENAQLLQEANQRAAELEALQQISLNVQAEGEPDQMLTSVVEQASKLLDTQGGLVWLLQSDNETLKVVVSHNLDKDYTNRTVKKGEGVTGRVLLLGEAVAVDNYRTFSGRSSEYMDAPFGAVLSVPLRWSGKVRGVLTVVHRFGRGVRFQESDIWLISLFASQSAIALEKSQLLHEAKRRAQQLTMLSDISKTISGTLNVRTVLPQVMNSAVKILDAEAGSLFLMNQAGDELTFEVVLGPTGSELVGAKVPVGVGIVGSVAKSKEALIINNVAKDPRWHTAFDEETNFKTRDVLCVPMISAERIVGVIEVINKKDGLAFVEEDVTLLNSFAIQSAIVIENAQIFTRTDQALSERVQELQTLQMFDQQLQRSLELEKVVDISLIHAMDALGVTIGTMGVFKRHTRSGIYLMAQYGMVEEMRRYKTDMWLVTTGVIGRVARTGEVALIDDVTNDDDYLQKSRSGRSMLIVPVIRDDRVIGVIDLESTSTSYFTDDDVTFVQLLASHAAIAIENAQLFEQVKAANEAKSEFMNTASHDLKVPMTSIKGYAKMLKLGAGGELSDTQAEFVEVIDTNIERMNRLVSDLLDVSRIEAGRIRLEIEDVQIKDVIDDVLRSVDNQIKARNLVLTIEMTDKLPTLRADYNRLVQITTNFVSNAYKYTPDGGTVWITAQHVDMPTSANSEPERGIAVTVKDTGFGISDEDQKKLFTNFFRSSDPNVREQPGTGLGLSITKKMIESHGGILTVKSKLGDGSAFIYTLPLISKIPAGVEVSER